MYARYHDVDQEDAAAQLCEHASAIEEEELVEGSGSVWSLAALGPL
ncbi:MAG: hypothetical protein JO304_10315 [Solirubrobacterales bacterium]|nr:hypothetical protein [Solirubrobacterales bacterium]